jgi:hypothetical protein
MKVFLSWSGIRGKAVADALGSWLPSVLNNVEPWISSDIDKGARWQTEVAHQLEEPSVAIVCLTWDSLQAPWILFEAGAAAHNRNTKVCTFLLDVNPSDVEFPLAQFQHTVATCDDVRRLVRTLNRIAATSGESPVDEAELDAIVERWWPEFHTALSQVPAVGITHDDLDREPAESIAAKALLILQAEELMGASVVLEDNDASNGVARYATARGRRDHIVFGPYKPLEAAGDYIAFYRLKIGPNLPPGPILYLDVAGAGYGSRILHRASFTGHSVYNIFALRFKVRAPGNMEYRVLPVSSRGEFWVDYIAILKANALAGRVRKSLTAPNPSWQGTRRRRRAAEGPR